MTPLIIPAPQNLSLRDGHFLLNAQTTLHVAPDAAAVGQVARDWLRQVVGGGGAQSGSSGVGGNPHRI